MLRILIVVGTRPNLVKAASVLSALQSRPDAFGTRLVDTGQHWDPALSRRLRVDLGLPEPDICLGVPSGPRTVHIARMVERLVPCMRDLRPDLVIVLGDVNSTLAGAIAARRCGLSIAHVEAGLRSGSRTMPEELNRIATDALSNLLFASEPSAVANLVREGHEPARIHLVGNVMIDTLRARRARSGAEPPGSSWPEAGAYGVATLHRPENVDDPLVLQSLLSSLADLARRVPIVFPVHPRTRAAIARHGFSLTTVPGLSARPPLLYGEMVRLLESARLVLTDSGGLQEEAAVLGIPCLTLRDTTERPLTATHGTNRVIGTRPERIRLEVDRILAGDVPASRPTPSWDGHAAERIAEILGRWTVAPYPSGVIAATAEH